MIQGVALVQLRTSDRNIVRTTDTDMDPMMPEPKLCHLTTEGGSPIGEEVLPSEQTP